MTLKLPSQVPVTVDAQSVPESVLRADVLSLYLQLLTGEFNVLSTLAPMEQALLKEKVRQNNRLYNPLVAIWLMVFQRLHGNVSMERAVVNVVHGLPDAFWPQPCKRRRENDVSGNDGSYNAARQELPKGVNVLSTLAPVEQIANRVLEGLLAQTGGAAPVFGRRAFFVDGTSGARVESTLIRTSHRPKLNKEFPPSKNQHGRCKS